MCLFQGLMAFTIQGDTAFVSAKGLFQTQCSGFHVLYQLLQFLKGLFKAGNGGGVWRGVFWHRGSVLGVIGMVKCMCCCGTASIV